jgi:hypothetical protein
MNPPAPVVPDAPASPDGGGAGGTALPPQGEPLQASAFTASAAARGVWALGFAAAAAALVGFVEHARPAALPAAAATAAPAGAAPRQLRLEATYAVAAWTVRCGGATVAASASDDQEWNGVVTAPGEIAIEADPADPADVRPHALRIVVDGSARTSWGAGAISELVPR